MPLVDFGQALGSARAVVVIDDVAMRDPVAVIGRDAPAPPALLGIKDFVSVHFHAPLQC